jgi:hypothetical protein
MGLSERRACSIVSADRKMVRYRSWRPPDTELRTQLRDLAHERKRFGYRRLFVLLRQEGEPSGIIAPVAVASASAVPEAVEVVVVAVADPPEPPPPGGNPSPPEPPTPPVAVAELVASPSCGSC